MQSPPPDYTAFISINPRVNVIYSSTLYQRHVEFPASFPRRLGICMATETQAISLNPTTENNVVYDFIYGPFLVTEVKYYTRLIVRWIFLAAAKRFVKTTNFRYRQHRIRVNDFRSRL